MLKLNLQLFAESTDPESPAPEEGGLAEWQEKIEQQMNEMKNLLQSKEGSPKGSQPGVQTIPAPETPEVDEDDPADPDKQPPPKSSSLARFLDWLI